MCAPLQPKDLEGIKNVLLVGIEAHVCVLQTTHDLLDKGVDVHVIVDGVSSRSRTDRYFQLYFFQIKNLQEIRVQANGASGREPNHVGVRNPRPAGRLRPSQIQGSPETHHAVRARHWTRSQTLSSNSSRYTKQVVL